MRPRIALGLILASLSIAACASEAGRAGPKTSPAAGIAAASTVRRPANPAERRALFASAHRRFAAGDYAGAAAEFDALLPVYPELQDYCLYHLASCYGRLAQPERALPLWQRLSREHPKSLYAATAILEEGRIARQRGDSAAARRLFEEARRAGDEAVAARAGFELAEVDVADGDLRSAHRRFMELREAAPGSALARQAKQRVLELRARDASLAPTGDALESELELLGREGDHAAAIALAERLLATAPPEKQPALLRLRADSERASGATEQALATLEEIFRGHPTSLIGRDAMYDYANLLWNRDRDAEAKRTFTEYERLYPGSRDAEVLYAVARIEQAAGNRDDAIADYARLARDYPSSKQASEARCRIGWIHYEGGDLRRAAQAFAEAAHGDAERRAEASYWRARSLERLGAGGEARAIYQEILDSDDASYYAHWAELRLGRSREGGAAVSAPASAAEIAESGPGVTDTYHLIRAHELQMSGLPRLARLELRALERTVPDSPELTSFLFESYAAVEAYRDAIRLAYRIRRLEPEILYPLAFWPLVTRYAGENDLDPLLVLALMRQESMFDPEARSSADARGLMQLLPSTAERVAGRTSRAGASDLYDPETNIALGTAHLETLMQAYGGDWPKALAAYNGGEAAVAKWQARFGHMESDEFVESITYRETRDYVKRVMGNYRRYREQYSVAASRGSDSSRRAGGS